MEVVLMRSNVVYNDDCLNVMESMPSKCVDLTLTDPPYGINLEYNTYVDTEEHWFDLMENVMPELIRVSKMVIMPCCPIASLGWFYENYPPDWVMCWYKGSTGHRSYIGFNDWEPHLVYGKNRSELAMHDYFQTRSSYSSGTFNHPCPKPVEWAKWIIERASQTGDLVFDPFFGTGTTGVVAKELGRNFIGVDIDEKYCAESSVRVGCEVVKGAPLKEVVHTCYNCKCRKACKRSKANVICNMYSSA
jgi:DNA modification methylase